MFVLGAPRAVLLERAIAGRWANTAGRGARRPPVGPLRRWPGLWQTR